MKHLLFRTATRPRHRVIVILLAVFLSAWSVVVSVLAAAGDFDLTFGNGGKVVTTFGVESSIVAVSVQKDGKIVAAGYAKSNPGFTVARYNSIGVLDSSWGTNGIVTTSFFGGDDTPLGVFVQTDGKIIVAGSVQKNTRFVFALARYDVSGVLDPAFGVNGKVTTELFDHERARDVGFQADGKTIVMGDASILHGPFGTALARYNSDGSLDSSFGVGGKVLLEFFAGSILASAVAVQPDNKIVVAGEALFHLQAFGLRRFNNDGSPDTAFGIGGFVDTDFGGSQANARDLATDENGKIVAAGIFVSASREMVHSALARYNYDGSLDATFGNGGKVISALDSTRDDVSSVAIQSDGKTITGGQNFSESALIARYNVNGALDTSFNGSGFVTTAFVNDAGSANRVNAVAVQPDGKILAAGGVAANRPFFDFALMRFDGASFDLCLQDESNGNLLQLNSTTGAYQFSNCSGLSIGGIGQLTIRGGAITLQHYASDRRVLAKIDTSTRKATASVQLFSQGGTFTLTDRNITDNTCLCQR